MDGFAGGERQANMEGRARKYRKLDVQSCQVFCFFFLFLFLFILALCLKD